MISTAKIFVGVDVSKATLDVYRPNTKEVFKIENSDEVISRYAEVVGVARCGECCTWRRSWLSVTTQPSKRSTYISNRKVKSPR